MDRACSRVRPGWLALLLASPFVTALIWLAAELLVDDAGLPLGAPWLALAALLAPPGVAVVARLDRRPGLQGLALVVPCFTAPLAALYGWAVVPPRIPGIGVAGPDYFVHWLTRYPNLGPVNGEVLAGILCILGASAIPVAYGFYRLYVGRPRRLVLGLLLGFQLLAFVPVLMFLDQQLLLLAWYGMPQMDRPIYLAWGPLLRCAALGVMIVGLILPGHHRMAE